MIPAVQLEPCHGGGGRGVGLTSSRGGPGGRWRKGGRDGQGGVRPLGLGQLSEVPHPGRQMDEDERRSGVPTARSAAAEESNSWSLNHTPPPQNHLASVAAGPTSEIKTRSSRWKDKTMHNMCGCARCDRRLPATNEAASVHVLPLACACAPINVHATRFIHWLK